MLIKNINLECTRKILDVFLEKPKRQFTFKQLRPEVTGYGETEIRKSLKELKQTHIFEVSFTRGRPRGGSRTEVYAISKDLSTFYRIFNIYMPDQHQILLKSEYINQLLNINGFIRVIDRIKNEFHNEDFKRLASENLLAQPATIKEYNKYPKVLMEMPEYLYEGRIVPISHSNDLIKQLSFLDPLIAIEFYRNRIGKKFCKLYRGLTKKDSLIRDKIREFVDYDIMLSPFTSYPVNDPLNLLLHKPFERIYDNAFILDESDHKRFIERAYIIYSNFAEILWSDINKMRFDEIEYLDYKRVEISRYYDRTDIDFRRDRSSEVGGIRDRLDYLKNIKNSLESIVKLSIHYWNIASYRFESINNFLIEYSEKYGSLEKCHIFQENGDINIVNILDRRSLWFNDWFVQDMHDTPLLSDFQDPFNQLRPCDAFGEKVLNQEHTAYDEILEAVKSNIEPRILN
jgi:hypothetical protein